MSSDTRKKLETLTGKDFFRDAFTIEEVEGLGNGKDDPLYYCASIGERLHGQRYRVLRKLGWGGHASVWLARDITEECFVAIKIMTGEATKTWQSGGSDEPGILKKACSIGNSHGSANFPTVIHRNEFFHTGSTAEHLCIVTEPLALSLQAFREQSFGPGGRMPTWIIRRLVRSLLLALNHLHENCGVVYADLKSDNILFRPKDVTSIIEQELQERPTRVWKGGKLFLKYEWKQTYVSQPLPLRTGEAEVADFLSVAAVLVDFGHSHWQDKHFREIIQPYALRAPEVVIGYPRTTSADIRSLGCLIHEWATGQHLFYLCGQGEWDREEDLLASMTEALEQPIPFKMIERARHRAKFFKDDGTFLNTAPRKYPIDAIREGLAFCLDQPPSLPTEEIDALSDFKKKCLVLQPEDRPTAAQLLQDPWLNMD